MFEQTSREWSQIRRCHRCGHTHTVEGDRVEKCRACGASFAPFFFAELTPEVLCESARSPAETVKPKALAFSSAKNYRAIVGVTWWWNDSIQGRSGELLMPRA